MLKEQSSLEGVCLITPQVFADDRGEFFESYQKKKYSEITKGLEFVQDNVSVSSKNILRGLHLQNPNSQGKLVQVLQGTVLDVAVDVRPDSSDFSKYQSFELSDKNHQQLYIPPGFAHGFLVLSKMAVFHYKCTDFYNKESEITICWDDKDIAIKWPLKSPLLSAKDKKALSLKEAAIKLR